jgi:hypothetical protein
MLFSKKFLLTLSVLFGSVGLGQGFSPIITCPGPYACILSSYLGLQFPDGSHQTTASGGGGGSGTVTSIGFTDGSTVPIYTIGSSPVTVSGVISNTLKTQIANKVFAGPTTGSAAQPTFRLLVAADIPNGGNLTDAGTDGIVVTGGTGAVIGSGTSLAQHVADSTHNGYLLNTDWVSFNAKAPAGNYVTALTGDVTGSGPGSTATTVISVGGSTAANVHSGELAANAATNINTVSTIVKRDVTGSFTAGNITANLIGIASGNPPNGRLINTSSPITGGGDLSADRTIAIPAATGSVNGYLASADWTTFNNKQSTLTLGNLTDAGTDGITIGTGTGAVVGSGTTISQHVADTTHAGYLASADWNTFNGKQTAGNYITALTGDVTASGPGSVAATVASVGGSSAANINTSQLATAAATNLNTASTIVKRDASGNFVAGNITAALTGTASGNLISGGALGTPSSGTLTNATGLPISGVSGLGTGVGTFLATPSSANLASAVTGATGSGALVFGTSPTLGSPTFTAPVLGTISSGDGSALTGTASSFTAGTATVANGLKTATTTVSISGATAPTSGQALVATSSTNATWQTPSAAGVASPTVSGTVTSFVPVIASGVSVTSGAAVTSTATDGFKQYQMATAGADRAFTLPAVAVSAGRELKVIKSDSGTKDVAGGYVVIGPNASDPIIGNKTNLRLLYQGAWTSLYSDGTSWYVTGGSSMDADGTGNLNYVAPISQNSSTGWGTSGSGVTLSTVNSGSTTIPRDITSNSAIKITQASGSTAYAYYRFQADVFNTVAWDYLGQQGYLTVNFDYGYTSGTNNARDWKVDLYCTGTANYSAGLAYVGPGSDQFTYPLPNSGSEFSQSGNEFNGFWLLNNAGSSSSNCPYYELRIGLAAASSGTTILLQRVFVGQIRGPVKAIGQIRGTYNNDAAGVGYVGEIIQCTVAQASAVSLTSATASTVCSMTLTSGDWDISGAVGFTPGATTSITQLGWGVNESANSFCAIGTCGGVPSSANGNVSYQEPYTAFVPNADFIKPIPKFQVKVSQSSITQLIYLIADATFSLSTLGGYGYMQARRAR